MHAGPICKSLLNLEQTKTCSGSNTHAEREKGREGARGRER